MTSTLEPFSRDAPIFIAGHRGMVGSAIVRQLVRVGHPKSHLITRQRSELDLTNQVEVRRQIEEVFSIAVDEEGFKELGRRYPGSPIASALVSSALDRMVPDLSLRAAPGVC